MPMIDVTAPTGLIPDEHHEALARELAHALLRAEGAPRSDPYLANTGVFIRQLPHTGVHTAGTARARTVRVDVLTPPGALNREGQRQLVAEATEIVTRHSGDPTQNTRTWVLLQEAAEGGWGVYGIALAQDEFAALRAQDSA